MKSRLVERLESERREIDWMLGELRRRGSGPLPPSLRRAAEMRGITDGPKPRQPLVGPGPK